MPANNKDRKKIINLLDKCKEIAYSGVTSIEYDILNCAKCYIETYYRYYEKTQKELENER